MSSENLSPNGQFYFVALDSIVHFILGNENTGFFNMSKISHASGVGVKTIANIVKKGAKCQKSTAGKILIGCKTLGYVGTFEDSFNQA